MYKQTFVEKVIEVEKVGCRRRESAGLHGHRKQVTEAKERPLEFKRKAGKGNTTLGKESTKGFSRTCSREPAWGMKGVGKSTCV